MRRPRDARQELHNERRAGCSLLKDEAPVSSHQGKRLGRRREVVGWAAGNTAIAKLKTAYYQYGNRAAAADRWADSFSHESIEPLKS